MRSVPIAQASPAAHVCEVQEVPEWAVELMSWTKTPIIDFAESSGGQIGTNMLQLPPSAISKFCIRQEISSSEVLSATTAEDAYCDDADFYRELGERVAAACSSRYGTHIGARRAYLRTTAT